MKKAGRKAAQKPAKKLGRPRLRGNEAAFAEALKELRPEYGLGRQVLEARMRAGLSQAELARRMGTSQSAIGRLEAGWKTPSIATLRKVAEATGSRLVLELKGLRD